MDHGRDAIRVNAVCPGFIETSMSSAFSDNTAIREAFVSATPLGRPGVPDDIAGVVAFLASEDARYISGQTIVVDGGLSAGSGIPNTPMVARKAREPD
jgi:NAD(P)-dependent dehydrogenase (short-subunit alcohol dehydrogenase family)